MKDKTKEGEGFTKGEIYLREKIDFLISRTWRPNTSGCIRQNKNRMKRFGRDKFNIKHSR